MRPAALLALLLLAGCSLDIPVENEMTDPSAVTDVRSGYELLSSAYGLYPCDFPELSLLAEDYVPQSYAGNDPSQLRLYYYHEPELIDFATDLWDAYYAAIVQVNALLEREDGLRAQQESVPGEIDYLLAEAQTLKALCYLDLLRLFATPCDDTAHPEGIILKGGTAMTRPARSTKEETVGEIERLLDRAEKGFARCTPEETLHGAGPGFCSAETVRGVRARLLLYEGDCDGLLELLPEESLPRPITTAEGWALAPAGAGTALYRRMTFYNSLYDTDPTPRQMKYALAPGLTPAPEDLRSGSYSVQVVLPGRSYSVEGKYCLARFQKTEIRTCFIIRPQELLFVRAEALARVGREDEAIRLVNGYLSLCRAPLLNPALSGDTLLDALLREKAKEMAGENTNFLDLIRCHKPITRYEMRSGTVRTQIAPDDYRRTLPIPYSEFKNNPSMVQNQGWPTKIQTL